MSSMDNLARAIEANTNSLKLIYEHVKGIQQILDEHADAMRELTAIVDLLSKEHHKRKLSDEAADMMGLGPPAR